VQPLVFVALTFGFSSGIIPADARPDDDAWPANVQQLHVPIGHRVQLLGALRAGKPIPELSLPISCFVDADYDQVGGQHVLYAVTLPPATNMTITLTPRGMAPFTLYAYAMPLDRHDLPDAAADASTCESQSRPGPRSERVVQLRGGDEPQNVVIGVTSGGEAGTGRFLLAVDVQ
jgi:hypothetical protein